MAVDSQSAGVSTAAVNNVDQRRVFTVCTVSPFMPGIGCRGTGVIRRRVRGVFEVKAQRVLTVMFFAWLVFFTYLLMLAARLAILVIWHQLSEGNVS